MFLPSTKFVTIYVKNFFLNLDELEYFINRDLETIVTPLNIKRFEQLLKQTEYNVEETKFLVDGFTQGFDIGYRGAQKRQSHSQNIPFTVGNEIELWNKIMKEVKAKRVAGPYDNIPFENFIQSPVGLVQKAGNKTQLIFHLSYQFSDEDNGKSLNASTPKEWCSV